MQANNRVLDDMVKVANGALGAMTGVKSEVESAMRQQFERVLSQMDVVSREEFEVVEAMASKARSENAELAEKLAALEARIEALAPSEPADAPTEKDAE
jgi:BMFP domain-containing protein YqiC